MDFQRGARAALPSAFTTVDGARAGRSRQQLRVLVRNGQLIAPFRGVRSTGIGDSLEARATAAALILPEGAAFSRRTAAELFGIDPRTPSERGLQLPLECTVPIGTVPARRRGIRSFSAMLPPDDVLEVLGVPCTDPDRTAADLLRWLPGFMALAVVDAMAHAHLVSLPEIDVILARHPGERNVARARRLLAAVEPRSESYGESWQRLRLLDAGFPRPEAQIVIKDSAGREIYRLDMGYRDRMIGFEYDGVEFHDEAAQRDHDELRRADLRKRFGWTVIGCGRGAILGRSMAFERAAGALLGLSPTNYHRAW